MNPPYYQDDAVTLHHGPALDVLATLPDESANCIVTSPPYFGLRSYLPADHPDKHREQGAEASPAEFIEGMRAVFAEARRVLAKDGTLWVNIGDSYSGSWGGQGITPKAAGMQGNVVASGTYRQKAGNQANAAVRATDQPAATIAFGHAHNDARWIGPDGGSSHLTVTEAAILQGFPSAYPWQGTRKRQFEQVGNAVPPPLAAAVVGAVA